MSDEQKPKAMIIDPITNHMSKDVGTRPSISFGEISDALAKMAMDKIRDEIRAMIREELSLARNTQRPE